MLVLDWNEIDAAVSRHLAKGLLVLDEKQLQWTPTIFANSDDDDDGDSESRLDDDDKVSVKDCSVLAVILVFLLVLLILC